MSREGQVAPWQERYLDVGQTRAHYLEAGEGDTLLLVHGGLVWCSAELTYGAVFGPLSRFLRVVAVDVVGFGLTAGRDPEDLTPQAQGAFLVQLLQRLGGPVHVGGNSHGGWLAQYLAHEAPHLVRSLVIINSLNGTSPIPHDYPLPADTEMPLTLDGIRAYLSGFYAHADPVTDARVRRTLELTQCNLAFARARRAVWGRTPAEWNRHLVYRGAHIAEHAGRLAIPVLLTWSRENPGASPEDAVAFLRRLQDGELHVWSNAGHHVMTEHPESWSETVARFVRAARG